MLEVVTERGNELNLERVSRPLDIDPRPEFAGLYQQFLGSLSRQRLDDARRREFEKAFGEPVAVALLGPWLEQAIVPAPGQTLRASRGCSCRSTNVA